MKYFIHLPAIRTRRRGITQKGIIYEIKIVKVISTNINRNFG